MLQFTYICGEAMCSPDSPLSDAEIAERYERFTGETMTADTVASFRSEFLERMRQATPGGEG